MKHFRQCAMGKFFSILITFFSSYRHLLFTLHHLSSECYFSLHRGLLLVFIEDTFILHRKVEELKTNTVCKY